MVSSLDPTIILMVPIQRQLEEQNKLAREGERLKRFVQSSKQTLNSKLHRLDLKLFRRRSQAQTEHGGGE